jgi:hypothetical protein
MGVVMLLAGCSECTVENLLSTADEEGREFTLTFGLNVPNEFADGGTRAFGEGDSLENASIVLLAFDENHKLTNLYRGTYVSKSGNCHTFSVTLRTTDKKRIFHIVVANSDFQLGDNIYGFESEIFNSSSAVVKDGTDAYWARFEVNNVQEGTDSEIATALQHVHLIRNFCKLTLTLGSTVSNTLSYVQWGLGNVPAQGSIAPYMSGETFAEYIKEDGSTTNYEDLEENQGYLGHIPRTGSDFYSTTEVTSNDDIAWVDADKPLYCYENEGSERGENWKETTIFIRGKKSGSDDYLYYRISIVNPDNDYEAFDLLRNIVYNIVVNELNATGYSSAAEAWNRPAGNNISGSTHTTSYPIITIDKAALRVEYIKKYVVSPAPFTMYYRYVPDVSTGDGDTYTAENDKIVLKCDNKTLVEGTEYTDYAFKSFTIAKEDYNTNYRLITFVPNTIKGESTVSSTVHVGVTDRNDLYRNVTFYLRQRYQLKDMSITKGDDDNSFVLGLKVPANLPEELFPLEFTLETYPVCIYADVSSGTIMNTECTTESIFETEDREGEETFQYIRRESYTDFETLSSVDGYRTINFYFKFNGVSLSTGKNTVLFGVYNDDFSCDPEGDRSSTTATPLKQSFVVTKNGTDSYSVY